MQISTNFNEASLIDDIPNIAENGIDVLEVENIVPIKHANSLEKSLINLCYNQTLKDITNLNTLQCIEHTCPLLEKEKSNSSKDVKSILINTVDNESFLNNKPTLINHQKHQNGMLKNSYEGDNSFGNGGKTNRKNGLNKKFNIFPQKVRRLSNDKSVKSVPMTINRKIKINQSINQSNVKYPLNLTKYYSKDLLADAEPVTLHNIFHDIVLPSFPDCPAIYYQNKKESWMKYTFIDYYKQICMVAKAFISLGLERSHAVAIMGFNSPEWYISNFAAIFAGGLSAGIYTTNTAEACKHILVDCKANICVIENENYLEKIMPILSDLPHLKAIIQYKDTLKPSNIDIAQKFPHIKFVKWSELQNYETKLANVQFDSIMKSAKPSDPCTMIYTSGTTGNSKGVMLTHDNIVWTTRATIRVFECQMLEERVISYLPLSHVAAQMLDMYAMLFCASPVWFAKPDALKGSLVETMKVVEPTIFIGVPRVWEKIPDRLAFLDKAQGLKKYVMEWAKEVGLKSAYAAMLGQPFPWGYPLANRVVFSRIKQALGLGSCRYFVSAGAPCSQTCIQYFASLGIFIHQIYGASETTGPISIGYTTVGSNWVGSCGLPLQGMEVKIDIKVPNNVPINAATGISVSAENQCTVMNEIDVNGNSPKSMQNNIIESPEGEICVKGRNVFQGYLNLEDATKEVIDSDGWFHTGDMGKLVYTCTGGPFIVITGRYKELIITAGGENVAPVPIETAIHQQLSHIISNVMVIGDYKKFLYALLTLQTEIDSRTGLPTSKVTRTALQQIEMIVGNADNTKHEFDMTNSNSYTETNNIPPSLRSHIQNAMKEANKSAQSNAATVKRWTILPVDFSLAGGELGPTLKLKRPFIAQKYHALIESLYANAEDSS